MASHSSAEADAMWWHSERGGALGQSAQAYTFDEPKSVAVDTWDALASLVNPRRRLAVQRYYRQAPVMSEFQRRHPEQAAVLEAVYTPRAWGDSMKALRLAMSMSGARHAVHVTALLPASNRLRASQVNKARTGETPFVYAAWEVSGQNGRLIRAVRDELTAMLDRALVCYEDVKARHAVMSKRTWSEDMLSAAAE